jgi:hypothetical protein
MSAELATGNQLSFDMIHTLNQNDCSPKPQPPMCAPMKPHTAAKQIMIIPCLPLSLKRQMIPQITPSGIKITGSNRSDKQAEIYPTITTPEI